MIRNIGAYSETEFKELLRSELELVRMQLTEAFSQGTSEWMTTTEVLDFLKIGRTTLHNKVSQGKIPVYRDPEGNKCYYNRLEIENYLRAHQTKK